jgi:hypothetical protein
MSDKTKVLIADDHQVIIEGIRHMLWKRPEFEVVGEAYNGSQAVGLIESLRPDIIVMDIKMPQLNGLEATINGIVALTIIYDKSVCYPNDVNFDNAKTFILQYMPYFYLDKSAGFSFNDRKHFFGGGHHGRSAHQGHSDPI